MSSSPTSSDPKRKKTTNIPTQPILPSFPRGGASPSGHMAATLPMLMPPNTLPSLAHENRTQLASLLPFPANTRQQGTENSSIFNTSPTSTVSSSVAFSPYGNHLPPNHHQPRTTDSRTSIRGSSKSYSSRDAIGRRLPPPIEVAKQALGRRPERSLHNPHISPAQPLPQQGFPTARGPLIGSPTLLQTPTVSQFLDPVTSTLPRDRFQLHVRQQPRAARAGPDGKDRRTIDPPPVLQLLINDFELDKDSKYLKASDWVVHAKLVSAQKPYEEINTLRQSGDGSSQDKVTRLLLGTTVSSPMYCKDDPDSENAPQHPRTKDSPPPSPSIVAIKLKSRRDPQAYKRYPGAYFIFADLSVRKAGQYRLEFTLMKMEPPTLQQGTSVPVISLAISDVFNVVNAKDFDQVQPSTNLVRGLLDRGAGFPLKLKKGLREGQRRRPRPDSDEEDDEDEDENETEHRHGDEDQEDHEDEDEAGRGDDG